jgi:hypothetical protein
MSWSLEWNWSQSSFRPTGCSRKPGAHRLPINPARPHPRASFNNSSDFLFLHFFQIPIPFCFVSRFVVPTKKLVFPLCPAPPIRTMDRLTSLCSRPCPRPLFLVLYCTRRRSRIASRGNPLCMLKDALSVAQMQLSTCGQSRLQTLLVIW